MLHLCSLFRLFSTSSPRRFIILLFFLNSLCPHFEPLLLFLILLFPHVCLINSSYFLLYTLLSTYLSSLFIHVVLTLIIILARCVSMLVETGITWWSSCLLRHPIRTYYTGLQCIREAVHHTHTFGSRRTEHVRNEVIKKSLPFHIRNNSELVRIGHIGHTVFWSVQSTRS